MRFVIFTILAAAALFVPTASACPSCGIGDKLGFLGPVIYVLFVTAPLFISYGVYRYIRNINRMDR